jgi:hypothetical protein
LQTKFDRRGQNGDTSALLDWVTQHIRREIRKYGETIGAVAHDDLGKLDISKGRSPSWIG